MDIFTAVVITVLTTTLLMLIPLWIERKKRLRAERALRIKSETEELDRIVKTNVDINGVSCLDEGKVIQELSVVDKLGEGGQGKVYRVKTGLKKLHTPIRSEWSGEINRD